MALRFVAFGGAFDFSTRGTNPGGGRLRRSPSPETKPEESIALPWERNTGVALVRDLLRNAPQARGLSKTIRVNTVGPLGKLVFRDEGTWQTKAAEWFNGTWGRHADYVDGSTWREMLQLCMSAIAFEGDFVAVFDDGSLSVDVKGGTGRVALFESDQICDLDKDDFARWRKATGREDWVQAGGVLVDGLGRKRGVVVCREHGRTSAPITMCLVLVVADPMAPDAENWRHVGRKFRLRQLRGTPEAFAAAPIIADNHEMLELERIAAKQNSSRPATVLCDDDGDDGTDAEITMPGAAAGSSDSQENAPAVGGASTAQNFSLPALERTGVGVDVVSGVRDIKYKDAATPNANLAPFVDYGMDMAGMALGIGHSQSRYKTDSSYTAFRGDLAMTWATFADNQQFIEDAFSDWVARRAIEWAVARGDLPAPPSPDWAAGIAWIYPRAPVVDEGKAVAAFRDGIACGMTTFQERFGPNWRDHLAQLAAEQKEAKRLGLSLAQWQGGDKAAPADGSAGGDDGEDDPDGEKLAEAVDNGDIDPDDLTEDQLALLAWHDLHKRGEL